MAEKKPAKGKRLTKTGRWKLTSKKGKEREFTCTLIKTINIGGKRLAIFSVPKAFLITHELQPTLAGDTALEGFVPRPTRGAGSWRRDRISG